MIHEKKIAGIMRATLLYYRNYECAINLPEWRGWAVKNRAFAVVNHDRRLNDIKCRANVPPSAQS